MRVKDKTHSVSRHLVHAWCMGAISVIILQLQQDAKLRDEN